MNLMTFSRLSIHCVSFVSRKDHSSFANWRWKDVFTSTLELSWSMRPSTTPSEIALTTHFSTPSTSSCSASATSESAISDLPCTMLDSDSSRTLARASSNFRECSSKSLGCFFWKAPKSETVPLRKTPHSSTKSLCLPFPSALMVSKFKMSSNWITDGSATATLMSSTAKLCGSAAPTTSGFSPWKHSWYLFRWVKCSTRLPSACIYCAISR
mmetsp:Transcript_12101/g.33919  ORF Transcript_12101/g.33919 Transcript_12101/m.33919 type:complete len:212 (+) Transcript_12101:384-1019(+)